jgi:hypothetical protein
MKDNSSVSLGPDLVRRVVALSALRTPYQLDLRFEAIIRAALGQCPVRTSDFQSAESFHAEPLELRVEGLPAANWDSPRLGLSILD